MPSRSWCLSLLVGLSGLALPVNLASPAAAETVPTVGTTCSTPGYPEPTSSFIKYLKLAPTQKTAVVTQAKVIELPPGGSYDRSTSLTVETSVTSSVTLSSDTSFSEGAVFAKAEESVSVSLQTLGTKTRTSSVSEAISISNTTSAQKSYVAYDGTEMYYGGVNQIACNWSTGKWEATRVGKWKSWHVEVLGYVRCDLTASNAVGARAKQAYC